MTDTFDWSRAINAGIQMAVENTRKGDKPDHRHVMWELLKEAAKVSHLAYKGNLQSGKICQE